MFRRSVDQEKSDYEEVFQHESSLRSWLIARYPGLEDVDDVVQDAYLKFLKAKKVGPIANPRSYLFVTAGNIVKNRFRHFRVERPKGVSEIDPKLEIDELRNPLEEISENEEIQLLVKAIKALPKRCRQVITLRKIYGYSMQEVAQILGISTSTVDTQCCVGMKKCAKFLKEHGVREY
ncbi:MAG: sigma-70 family RNA polymerase sigma factor [Opitutales bacterium]|nr:sigma-70 family RNA polymerase sigma factor [Opitutales bacterium]